MSLFHEQEIMHFLEIHQKTLSFPIIVDFLDLGVFASETLERGSPICGVFVDG